MPAIVAASMYFVCAVPEIRMYTKWGGGISFPQLGVCDCTAFLPPAASAVCLSLSGL